VYFGHFDAGQFSIRLRQKLIYHDSGIRWKQALGDIGKSIIQGPTKICLMKFGQYIPTFVESKQVVKKKRLKKLDTVAGSKFSLNETWNHEVI
jgi:hypothetical protein